jgi:hypothetical protein
MHPWLAHFPTLAGAFVPCSPNPGADSWIQYLPSGLSGPGAT